VTTLISFTNHTHAACVPIRTAPRTCHCARANSPDAAERPRARRIRLHAKYRYGTLLWRVSLKVAHKVVTRKNLHFRDYLSTGALGTHVQLVCRKCRKDRFSRQFSTRYHRYHAMVPGNFYGSPLKEVSSKKLRRDSLAFKAIVTTFRLKRDENMRSGARQNREAPTYDHLVSK
jgi:hypothetical protein